MSRLLLLMVVLMQAMAFSSVAIASNNDSEGLPLGQLLYPYKSWDQPVQVALKLFGKNTNIAISIDEAIEGSFSFDNKEPQTRTEFLNRVAERAGFTWYYDGYQLIFEDLSKYTTRNIALDKQDSSAALGALRSMAFFQEKFLIEAIAEKSIVRVSGPESYVETVEDFLTSMEAAKPKKLVILRGQRPTNIDDALGLLSTEVGNANAVAGEAAR